MKEPPIIILKMQMMLNDGDNADQPQAEDGNAHVSATYIATVVNDKETLHEAIRRNQFYTPGIKESMMTIEFMKNVSEGTEWLPKCSEIRLLNCVEPPSKQQIAEMLYQRMHAYQPEGEPFDSMFRRCAARIRKNPPDIQYMLALLSTIDNQNEIFAKGYKRPRAFQPGAVND